MVADVVLLVLVIQNLRHNSNVILMFSVLLESAVSVDRFLLGGEVILLAGLPWMIMTCRAPPHTDSVDHLVSQPLGVERVSKGLILAEHDSCLATNVVLLALLRLG